MANRGSYESGRQGDDRGRYGGGRDWDRDQQRNFDRSRDDGGYDRPGHGQVGNRGEQSYGRPGQYARGDRGGGHYGQSGFGEASGQHGAESRGDHDHEPHYRQWRDQQMASHDQDYARWRDNQGRRYDEDYGAWRAQRHEAFSREFHDWRANNARHTGVGGVSPTSSSGDPSGLSGAATGARGAQSGHSGPVSGVSSSSGGATGSAGITGGSSDVAGYPGAAGTGAVVGAYEASSSRPAGDGAKARNISAADSATAGGTTPDVVQSVTDGHRKDDDKKR